MKKIATVDWEEQWRLFAEGFKEGKAHIDLAPFGASKTLLLLPGPGFGDLSHPTTRLMLQIMKGIVVNQAVIDIGSGSGILTLGALLLGARSARGIDIDPDALRHARKNAKLNHLNAIFSKKLPKKMGKENIFLMNMIFPEQRDFNPERFNLHAKYWIVSGILASQKEAYLKQAKEWNWRALKERRRSEWMGWLFENAHKKRCS